jgi:hypothetical protein
MGTMNRPGFLDIGRVGTEGFGIGRLPQTTGGRWTSEGSGKGLSVER